MNAGENFAGKGLRVIVLRDSPGMNVW